MEKRSDREVREKLATLGAGSLSDAELLSIIIREGTHGSSALELADRMLDSFGGSLSRLSRAGLAELRMTEGIGMTRAAVLSASFELSARMRRQEAESPGVISSREDVVSIFAPVLSSLPHEEMWALYLTSANGVIEKRKVSQGGVQALVVDSRLVVKRALELLASSVILVHNHPSGVASPSGEDIELTERIERAAALFDIMLTDHVIIASDSSFSFRQHGFL